MEKAYNFEKVPDEKKFQKLQEIYREFLSEQSLYQVNVQKVHVENIEEALKQGEPVPPDVFKDVIKEVKSLMKDTYSRFKESKEFEDYRDSVVNLNFQKEIQEETKTMAIGSRKSVSDLFRDLFKSSKLNSFKYQ
jgi:glycosylphosphatidylinositol transamidase (GPIT) subunit GPI8